MKILINAIPLKKEGGSSRFLEELMFAFRMINSNDDFFLCLNKNYSPQYKGPFDICEIIEVSTNSIYSRVYWEELLLPKIIKRKKIDILISLLNFGPKNVPIPQILFVQNVSPFCNYYPEGLHFKYRFKDFWQRVWLRKSILNSDFVVTPSVFTSNLILSYFPGVKATKLKVIPHGLDKKRYLNILRKNNFKLVHEKNLLTPNILYVSHFLPHKNFQILPKVVFQLKQIGLKPNFIFTGDQRDYQKGYDKMMKEARDLQVLSYLRNEGRIPLEDAYSLYGKADIFFFPSVCESFGFPMVEAMGAGLPIVAADTSINREICGDSAVYFSPFSATHASKLIVEILQNSKLRDKLSTIAKDRFNKKILTMKEYAYEIMKLIRKVNFEKQK